MKVIRLLEYNKNQINEFKQKFGGSAFEFFKKSQQRLKNAGYTTDINTYLSDKWSKEDFLNLLNELDKQVSDKRGRLSTYELNKEWEPEGKYNFLGTFGGYDIYEPLDVEASISMGVNTDWCITGRYGHYGHPEFKPSEKDAKHHWDDYKQNGVKTFIFLLDPKTHYGKFAITLYDDIRKIGDSGDRYGTKVLKYKNFDIHKDSNDMLTTSNYKPTEELISILKFIESKLDFKFKISIKDYSKDSDEWFIPTQATKIGEYKYSDNKNICNLKIPSNIKLVGEYAFSGCVNLKNIVIENGVTKIDAYAFSNCHKLENVQLPNTITKISNYTFWDCEKLKNINIPQSVTTIDNGAFNSCESLESIVLPYSVETLGNNAFCWCKSLSSIKLSKNIKKIENMTFAGCESLINLEIPAGIEELGELLFIYSGVQKVTIPDSVIKIDAKAFDRHKDIIIKCSKGSYAYKYAKAKRMKVEIV